MGKINDLLERMRKHTSTYPNVMAIAMIVMSLIYLESIIFSEHIIKPNVEPENYDMFYSVNLWVQPLILYPLVMRFFGVKLSLVRDFFKYFQDLFDLFKNFFKR